MTSPATSLLKRSSLAASSSTSAAHFPHYAQKPPAFEPHDLGNVGDPLGPGSLALKSRSSRFVTPEGRAPGLPRSGACAAAASPAGLPPIDTDARALVGEVLVHAWRADQPPSCLRGLDTLLQARIDARLRLRRATRPGVEATRGDFEAAAHHRNRILAAAVCNYREPLGDCFAKYAAALVRSPGRSAGSSTVIAGPARRVRACTQGCNACASTWTLLWLSMILSESVRRRGVEPDCVS